jgi:hypothetical protein
MLVPHFVQPFNNKGDEIIRDTGEWFIQYNKQILLIGSTLEDEFEEEKFALSTRESCHELTGNGPTHDDGLVLLLTNVCVPVGKLCKPSNENIRNEMREG